MVERVVLAENDDRQDKWVFIRTGLDLSLQVIWLNKQGGTVRRAPTGGWTVCVDVNTSKRGRVTDSPLREWDRRYVGVEQVYTKNGECG